ncbi:anti-sigma factor [Lacisediminihabitans changchengi]|uniref:anti-sigma factor n=1 Tax=Lacisediminihabitans changchengi TaxID=2787634 RepID=UPI0027DE1559|nr:anti-sigma factor [Lacisediminihabitans changchengi]
MTEHDDLHLLAGAYALGALDETEREEFEKYLATSEEARAELAAFTDTAVMLGMSTTPVTPPPSLKGDIMARIAVTPQLPSLEPGQTNAPKADAAPTNVTSMFAERAIRSVSAETVAPAERKAARRWYSRPSTILVAAAAAAAIFVGGTALGTSMNTPTQQVEPQAVGLTEISAAADAQRAEAAVAGGGNATVIWSAQLARSAVVVSDLPALPSDKTYELWYIDGAHITPAGTFTAAENGKTVRVLDGKMSSGDTIGITVEPAGGSKKPTTEPVASIPTA